MSRVQMPPPRAHLAGTLQLLRRMEALCGGHPHSGPLWEFLDRPQDLPDSVRPEHATLKYDAYLACSAERPVWGVAISDRYEGSGMLAPLQVMVDAMPGRYDLGPALALQQILGRGERVVAVGFDDPKAAPRIKMYLQESRWGTGLGTGAALAPALAQAAPGTTIPPWCMARQLDVVAVGLLPDGSRQLKLYLGGPGPDSAAAGAPPGVHALIRQMKTASPLEGGWYYLTVRCRVDQPWRYAINKIYNPVQIGFTAPLPGPAEAWADVAALFDGAGNRTELDELRSVLRGSGLVALPTATALEGDGDQTDIYVAAWSGLRT